jgi:hypothetical protein
LLACQLLALVLVAAAATVLILVAVPEQPRQVGLAASAVVVAFQRLQALPTLAAAVVVVAAPQAAPAAEARALVQLQLLWQGRRIQAEAAVAHMGRLQLQDLVVPVWLSCDLTLR